MKDNHNQNESLFETSIEHEIDSDLKDEKKKIGEEFDDQLLDDQVIRLSQKGLSLENEE